LDLSIEELEALLKQARQEPLREDGYQKLLAAHPANVSPDWKNAILHARIDIGETELMGADVPPERFQPMRSVYLSLTVNSISEAERIYALLSDGGRIFMPMEETFFAFRFGMLRDKFGTSWMIHHERPRPQSA